VRYILSGAGEIVVPDGTQGRAQVEPRSNAHGVRFDVLEFGSSIHAEASLPGVGDPRFGSTSDVEGIWPGRCELVRLCRAIRTGPLETGRGLRQSGAERGSIGFVVVLERGSMWLWWGAYRRRFNTDPVTPVES
jgi:hypothetical protein